jgi:hypothetical protein
VSRLVKFEVTLRMEGDGVVCLEVQTGLAHQMGHITLLSYAT